MCFVSATVRRATKPAVVCAWVGVWLGVAVSASAATVTQMPLSQLADEAGQVIVGRVVDVQAAWAEHPRRIESTVTFEQVDYLKGAPRAAASTFSLVVPGGTVGDTHLRISGTPKFAVGEKWVLFLWPRYRTFPVVGLFQGAFQVRLDGQGIERVYQAWGDGSRPLVGFDAAGVARVAKPRTRTVEDQLAHRVVETHGVRVRAPADRAAEPVAMSYAAFLEQARPVLAVSRDHRLSGPAGQPERFDYHGQPLMEAGALVREQQTSRPTRRTTTVRQTQSNHPRPRP